MLRKVLALALLAPACLASSGGHENYLEAHERLKRDLFINYDKDLIPWMEKDVPVNVSAGFSVHTMDLNAEGMLDMVAWFRSMWKDQRLTWSPEDYHGISELRIPADQVWVPDFEVYNAVKYDQGSFSDSIIKSRSHYAILYSNGKVLYIPPTRVTVRCEDEDYKNFPWGEYDCKLKLGSWTFSSLNMQLNAYENNWFVQHESPKTSPVVFTEDSFKQDPFEAKVYDCCPETYQSLNFHFKVQRQFRFSEAGGFEKNPNEVKMYKSKGHSI